ncbi:MAG: homocysteine S-methyltransferase family protein [Oscillospiraceae bacterium]|nr:homocysteine S-methyltransferase family protein [Oscillospiraceae bacterium]
MDFLTALKQETLLFDGSMGIYLSNHLKPGEPPYTLCVSNPDAVLTAHKAYVAAGADVLTSCTFTCGDADIVRAGVTLAKRAGGRFTALGFGPTGRLMEPMGDLTFEEAYTHFARLAAAGAEGGADLVLVETMSDVYECKAAILAIKETTSLPVVCTVTLSENGRTLTGSDIQTAVAVLESLGVNAVGLNCSLGPAQLKPLLKEMLARTSLPVVIQPNAGLPRVSDDGGMVYDVSAAAFAEYAAGFVRAGARVVGGCCGTTPEHIALTKKLIHGLGVTEPARATSPRVLAASGAMSVTLGNGPLVIGERLNPTGKKPLQKALREGDMEIVEDDAIAQQEAGCHLLDINAGLPNIDESGVLVQMIRAVQSVSRLPVQIDSADPKAVEAALRAVNGKAIVNSVNGSEESLNAILPLVKKYGASVIGLALDENGIPETAEGRLAVARKIRDAVRTYGIDERDLLIDCLTLSVAAQPQQTMETLRAVRLVKEELGLATVLGVSNVSYGMPEREKLGSSFLTAALASGLDAAIINPLSAPFADAVQTWRLLSGLTLAEKIVLSSDKPLQWFTEQYDAGKIFLPDLLAAAAREIERLKQNAPSAPEAALAPIVLASVEGDIHDIGKNIVKAMLESHGFPVVDLGKDVPAARVIDAARAHKSKLVGLSALMTTTITNMQKTIDAVRAALPHCAVMIGGAAVDASVSGAAHYGKDAMAAVAIAKKVLEP